jgi:hypothetical protein
VFHVLDPFECNFNYSAEARFRDLETGEMILTNPNQIRPAYIEKLGEYIEKFKQGCRESHIDYHFLDTSTPFDKALFGYLAKRSRLG